METQGGLYVPAGKERHVFKAPEPRPSLLGRCENRCPVLRQQRLAAKAHGKQTCTHEKATNAPEGFHTQPVCTLQVCCEVFAGLDKLAQQKRKEAGKALPALGKRSRLELDDAEEEAPIASMSQQDAGNKGQPRQYRSNRLDTPSHPGQPPMLWLISSSLYLNFCAFESNKSCKPVHICLQGAGHDISIYGNAMCKDTHVFTLRTHACI